MVERPASVDGENIGMASAIDGDNGSISFFALIDITIFSKPAEVICFWLPLLDVYASVESFLAAGRLMSSGNDRGRWRLSNLSSSSDAIESTLVESSGMSFEPGLGPWMLIAGVIVDCG